MIIFPVQLTTSRIGNLTRLIHTLLYVMTIHTYIHTYMVTRRSCCAERLAEFNGNCESYCSLEQLVASLSAADEGKSAAGTYHPNTEGYYNRRHLYKPPGLLYCGGCTWARISRQPTIAITWHFSQQTLLEPLTVSGARASCFGERYRDVLYQNLDENNTQTSIDCCTVVLRT